MSYEEFVTQLADAYEHLYDLVSLRHHPFVGVLTDAEDRKENAWQLHHLLVTIIDELDPGPNAPAFSREWRRYRLMMARYVEGMSPQVVSEQLAISRRHFYREHDLAIEAVAQILWPRYVARYHDAAARASETSEPIMAADESEVAPGPQQFSGGVELDAVIDGVLPLLEAKLKEHEIRVHRVKSEVWVPILAEHQPARQLMLALLAYLVDRSARASLSIVEQFSGDRASITITAYPLTEQTQGQVDSGDHRLTALHELALLCGAQLTQLSQDGGAGFEVGFALVKSVPTILVVDDNADILELFKRYLERHHLRIMSAASAQEALQLVKKLYPSAIVLDLMMPDQDGWDLLQILKNQASTASIPVIICSILPQAELALSLGATAFLQKPFSEQALVSLLEDLAAK